MQLLDSWRGETMEVAWTLVGELGLNCEKKKLLVIVEKEATRSGNKSRVRSLKLEINVLLDTENRMWCQRSRVLWLSNGDSNSKFFHTKATQCFRKNFIQGLRVDMGY